MLELEKSFFFSLIVVIEHALKILWRMFYLYQFTHIIESISPQITVERFHRLYVFTIFIPNESMSFIIIFFNINAILLIE